jgi:peptidoglycan/xylan/chitin deacetylase (PgdA/CDA1 family)
MYHYIWPDTEEVPAGIRPLLASEFIEQLDELEGRYDIVGPERFLERLDETSDRPPCLLTFDDGTRDHAHVATPILANREMAGVFFIISDAARGKLMPTTHLTHWLLGRDDEDVWKALGAYAAKDPAMLGDAGEAKRIYHYETQTRARIKYALNMAMSPKRSRQFALSMLERVGMSEKQLARDWFASVADLEAMHRSGMTLALHGKTHTSLQQLGPAIAEEIDDCSEFLHEITAQRPTWWACPFGGTGAPADDHATMQNALKKAGVLAAVSTAASSVPERCDPMSIPRVDCINLPPRKAWP